jgi:hypothetical protein
MTMHRILAVPHKMMSGLCQQLNRSILNLLLATRGYRIPSEHQKRKKSNKGEKLVVTAVPSLIDSAEEMFELHFCV